MSGYNFHDIFEALEFQDFARDMIQVRDNLRFESFGQGKDGGMDARCLGEDGFCTILQAKRWKNTSVLHLKELKAEKEKMDLIKPDRYILVTTQNFSPLQKQRIKELFEPYILREEDIVGENDLNNYLSGFGGLYSKVEEKYFKLWIQNTDMLKRVLQETVYGALMEESRIELKNAVENAGTFVETQVYYKALNQLKKNKVIIISGEPGMGKTTLAYQLSLYYRFKKEYTTFVWANEVEDLYRAHQMSGKKVVIYDDFWGGNAWKRIEAGREEGRLQRFIDLVQKSDDFILIMTTREYVLEQGLKQNEDMRRNMEKNKLECRLEDYSNVEKVKIYLEHLKKAMLTPNQLNELFHMHRSIVSSPNYNPRVIEAFVKDIVTPDMKPEECSDQFLNYLRNPKDFWKKIFGDLSPEARALYVALYLMPVPVELDYVKACYTKLLPFFGNPVNIKEFGRVIAELERTVIRTDPYLNNDRIIVKFRNPSARDFMHEYLMQNMEQQKELLLESCGYFFQCIQLLELLDEAGGENSFYHKVMERAIALINSESMFLWKQREALQAGERYYYQSLPQSEAGYSRVYQIISLYREEKCGELRPWFVSVFNTVLDKLKKTPCQMNGEDIIKFPEIAVCALAQGIFEDEEQLISAYFHAAMKNRMRIEDEPFHIEYSKSWNDYVEKNKDAIGKYLEIFYRGEMCMAAAEGDIYLFADLEDARIEDFNKYDLTMSDEFQKTVMRYDQWLDSVDLEDDEPEEDEDLEDEKQYDSIVSRFEAEFLGKRFNYIEDISEYILQVPLPEEVKNELLRIREEWEPWYWYEFVRFEEPLTFLLAVIERQGRLASGLKEALEDIFQFIGGCMGCGGLEAAEYIYGLGEEDTGELIWTRKMLTEKAEELLEPKEGWIDTLENSGILLSLGKWYCFSNNIILVLAYLRKKLDHTGTLALEYSRDLKNLCPGAMTRLWRIYESQMDQGLLELDGAGFEKYVIRPAAQEFCSKVEGENDRETLHNILFDLSYSFDIDENGDVSGSECSYNRVFNALEAAEILAADDIIPWELDENQKNLLKKNGFYESEDGEKSIELLELEKKGLLDALGISAGVWQVWKTLKQYTE